MLTESELTRRKLVWTALSEFWLDTELTDSDLQRIAGVAAASGYTIPELREIYLWEVAPVVHLNLCSVAGEWAGFDDEWLHSEAQRRAEHRSLSLRLWMSSGIGRWLIIHAGERHWRNLAERLTTPENFSSATVP